MKALVANDYGTPETLTVQELPVPQPGRGQVQVRIRAASLNPADLRTLSGVLRERAPLTFPHVPGSDFAGTVTKIGDGVTRFTVGDEVFGLGLPRAAVDMAVVVSSPPSLTTGTMAEYAVFEAEAPALALRPKALAADHAASLPIVGLTAMRALRAGEFQPGDDVLVIGATGGVGSAVVPLLAAAKIHVIATARPDDERYIRDLGATDVIDNRATDLVTETLRRHPDGVAGVVNLALPGHQLIDIARTIRAGGRLVNIAYPSPDPAAFTNQELTVETVFTTARPGDLAELAGHAIDGSLPAALRGRYRLDDAARAYVNLIHEHTVGKLIVVLDEN